MSEQMTLYDIGLEKSWQYDEESGILHRKHAECNLAFLAELERNNG